MSLFRTHGIDTRCMLMRDLPAVLAIEEASFEFPWTEDDFIQQLRKRNVTGLVVEDRDTVRVVGYVVYELHRQRLHILSMAVDPGRRREKIGSLLLGRLAQKLSPQGRRRIMLETRETNLTAQLFFRACGYAAVSVLREFYEDTDEDAYVFQYRMAAAAPAGSEAAC